MCLKNDWNLENLACIEKGIRVAGKKLSFLTTFDFLQIVNILRNVLGFIWTKNSAIDPLARRRFETILFTFQRERERGETKRER